MLQPLHKQQQDKQLKRQLPLVRKLGSPGGVNAVPLGHLVFLKDHTTGTLFLANMGASVSLVPGPASPQGRLLTAANGVAIATGPERQALHPSPERQPVGNAPVQLHLHHR